MTVKKHIGARATAKFLEREMPDFISPLLWLPNSSDFNPVDYSMWSILQEKVYKTSITDLEDLKQHIKPSLPSWITPSFE